MGARSVALLLDMGQQSQLLGGALSHRYGALTFGNVQKSIPASFGARAPAMVRKIAVRRTAQVGSS